MRFHHVTRDRQSETETTFRSGAFGLLETIEHVRESPRLGAFAGIRHGDARLRVDDLPTLARQTAPPSFSRCRRQVIRWDA